ncbi:unnamed protein product [Prorocentrum cordatum]|uniref:Uncharacterized protein n=1 Tax=Prorocentrum cordatum TaxID=2364126 RepID=A0ABN9RMD3_9DINO|nr:unnamed protein product [Polarella glacialis]
MNGGGFAGGVRGIGGGGRGGGCRRDRREASGRWRAAGGWWGNSVKVRGPHGMCTVCGAHSARRRAVFGAQRPEPQARGGASAKEAPKRKRRDRILAGRHPGTNQSLEEVQMQVPVRRGRQAEALR